jgi:toxin ParE1/3/4
MRLVWSASALEDRNQIFDYIEKENPRGAIVIDGRISEQVEQLLRFPATGRKGRIQGTRELVIHGTAYIASYLVVIWPAMCLALTFPLTFPLTLRYLPALQSASIGAALASTVLSERLPTGPFVHHV